MSAGIHRNDNGVLYVNGRRWLTTLARMRDGYGKARDLEDARAFLVWKVMTGQREEAWASSTLKAWEGWVAHGGAALALREHAVRRAK